MDVHQQQDFSPESRQLRALVDAGEVEDAEQLLRRLAAERPDEAWPLNELVWLLQRQANWPQALRAAEKLRELRPDNLSGYAVAIGSWAISRKPRRCAVWPNACFQASPG